MLWYSLEAPLRKHMLWYSLEVPRWGTSNEYHNMFSLSICLCWGFTAQSTQRGHVERDQFT